MSEFDSYDAAEETSNTQSHPASGERVHGFREMKKIVLESDPSKKNIFVPAKEHCAQSVSEITKREEEITGKRLSDFYNKVGRVLDMFPTKPESPSTPFSPGYVKTLMPAGDVQNILDKNPDSHLYKFIGDVTIALQDNTHTTRITGVALFAVQDTSDKTLLSARLNGNLTLMSSALKPFPPALHFVTPEIKALGLLGNDFVKYANELMKEFVECQFNPEYILVNTAVKATFETDYLERQKKEQGLLNKALGLLEQLSFFFQKKTVIQNLFCVPGTKSFALLPQVRLAMNGLVPIDPAFACDQPSAFLLEYLIKTHNSKGVHAGIRMTASDDGTFIQKLNKFFPNAAEEIQAHVVNAMRTAHAQNIRQEVLEACVSLANITTDMVQKLTHRLALTIDASKAPSQTQSDREEYQLEQASNLLCDQGIKNIPTELSRIGKNFLAGKIASNKTMRTQFDALITDFKTGMTKTEMYKRVLTENGAHETIKGLHFLTMQKLDTATPALDVHKNAHKLFVVQKFGNVLHLKPNMPGAPDGKYIGIPFTHPVLAVINSKPTTDSVKTMIARDTSSLFSDAILKAMEDCNDASADDHDDILYTCLKDIGCRASKNDPDHVNSVDRAYFNSFYAVVKKHFTAALDLVLSSQLQNLSAAMCILIMLNKPVELMTNIKAQLSSKHGSEANVHKKILGLVTSATNQELLQKKQQLIPVLLHRLMMALSFIAERRLIAYFHDSKIIPDALNVPEIYHGLKIKNRLFTGIFEKTQKENVKELFGEKVFAEMKEIMRKLPRDHCVPFTGKSTEGELTVALMASAVFKVDDPNPRPLSKLAIVDPVSFLLMKQEEPAEITPFSMLILNNIPASIPQLVEEIRSIVTFLMCEKTVVFNDLFVSPRDAAVFRALIMDAVLKTCYCLRLPKHMLDSVPGAIHPSVLGMGVHASEMLFKAGISTSSDVLKKNLGMVEEKELLRRYKPIHEHIGDNLILNLLISLCIPSPTLEEKQKWEEGMKAPEPNEDGTRALPGVFYVATNTFGYVTTSAKFGFYMDRLTLEPDALAKVDHYGMRCANMNGAVSAQQEKLSKKQENAVYEYIDFVGGNTQAEDVARIAARLNATAAAAAAATGANAGAGPAGDAPGPARSRKRPADSDAAGPAEGRKRAAPKQDQPN